MSPEEAARLLQAYADGELDPGAALELEAQLAASPALRAAHERMRALSGAIRDKADYHAAPPALLARLRASLPEEAAPARRARWRVPAAAFASAAILAVALALSWQRPPGGDEALVGELLASHARAALGQRMIDVASSDQHTVKPWLSARLPFSPPVADFAKDGFPLLGGRVDYVGGRPVAVLVYQRRKHVIEVFVWPGAAPARAATRDGLRVASFSRDGMSYWLVSDVEPGDLARLEELL